MELRELARKARSERIAVAPPAAVPVPSERDTRNVDDMSVDYERARDLPKESREEKEERLNREREYVRSEASERRGRVRLEAKEKMLQWERSCNLDQGCSSQEKGMDSGFATDDAYNVYDKGLFTAQPTLSTLYRPKKDADSEMYGGADEQLDKIMKTGALSLTRHLLERLVRGLVRDGPVQFEKEVEEADPFGLDQFLTEVKKGKKAMSNVGSGGTMKASAGSTRDGYETSSRTRIAFDKGR
ncbi:SNW domain-containing protein 1 [Datura stramonium]|uniref:SNW domain-containing protein 1 n=1 Tax=Datura stramonium TaxID=4076 RepID=A0ABS8T2Q9_DATST|nr:SNW domain-containing protein 1 [Datura stramonium]